MPVPPFSPITIGRRTWLEWVGRATPAPVDPSAAVPFAEAVRVWAKIGVLGFGGPAAQIALMHRELVERRRWIDEERFLHALNYCMLLPGPEAQQLATYIGWLMHRTKGGIVAGTLFVLPGFVVIAVLSMVYAAFRQLPAVDALFFGLKAAVLAVVVEALLRIGKRALQTRLMVVIAGLGFVAMFLFAAPFPLVIVGAALVGLLAHRVVPRKESAPAQPRAAPTESVVDRMAATGALGHTRPSSWGAVRTVVVWGALWALPLLALAIGFGQHSVFVELGLFFSKAAVVTFGGAYAVLGYVAQQAVETHGWLEAGEMVDGLGLAETTPGPLILVLQFVGFMGAYRLPGALPPMLAGLLGSAVTVWVTFVPCFLWIFLGAPFIESLRGNRLLGAALSAITAAVVGVILNLSIWFALHVLFGRLEPFELGAMRLLVPVWRTLDMAAVVLATAALLAMLRFKLSLPVTLAGSAALGFAWRVWG